MEEIKIDSSSHSLYSSFKSLYSTSFPVFEQRTERQQGYAFNCSNYHLIGYKDDNVFIGFIAYWEFKNYIYIEHFAINTDIRGKGYGSKLLNNLVSSTEKTVLLEIDPITDSLSAARLRFYQACGFHVNDYKHKHPPYREGYKPHNLIVLTTSGRISKEDYNKFREDLTTCVMNNR